MPWFWHPLSSVGCSRAGVLLVDPRRREQMFRIFRTFGVVGVAGLLMGLAVAAYAFTNSIQVNGGNNLVAGFGQQSLDTFGVQPHYDLGADHDTVTDVTFTLATAPNASATLNVDIGDGHWLSGKSSTAAGAGNCAPTDAGVGKAWKCTPAGAEKLDSDITTNLFKVEIAQ
jgi:hypothetical protein